MKSKREERAPVYEAPRTRSDLLRVAAELKASGDRSHLLDSIASLLRMYQSELDLWDPEAAGAMGVLLRALETALNEWRSKPGKESTLERALHMKKDARKWRAMKHAQRNRAAALGEVFREMAAGRKTGDSRIGENVFDFVAAKMRKKGQDVTGKNVSDWYYAYKHDGHISPIWKLIFKDKAFLSTPQADMLFREAEHFESDWKLTGWLDRVVEEYTDWAVDFSDFDPPNSP